MASVSEPGRILVTEPVLQWDLRLLFLSHLAEEPRYRNIHRQELAPAYDAARKDHARRSALDQVVRQTATSLRLTWKSEPSPWIVDAILHDFDEEGGPGLIWLPLTNEKIDFNPEFLQLDEKARSAALMGLGESRIDINVSYTGARIELVTDRVTVVNEDLSLGTSREKRLEFVPARALLAFEEWDELKKSAERVLDDWIAETRTRFEAIYAYRKRNRAAVDRRGEELFRLYRWIVRHESIAGLKADRKTRGQNSDPLQATKDSLRSVAAFIELDTPNA